MQLSFFDLFGRVTEAAGQLRQAKRRPPQAGRLRRQSAGTLGKPPLQEVRIRRRRRVGSDPELVGIWKALRRRWFPARPDIDDYQVLWSKRPQKRTLASCNISSKRVLVARELNYPEQRVWLEPLLYHEMIHAYLGDNEQYRDGRIAWHGRAFRNLEKQHSQIAVFDEWVKSGGWARAVRSDRAKRAHQRRKFDRTL